MDLQQRILDALGDREMPFAEIVSAVAPGAIHHSQEYQAVSRAITKLWLAKKVVRRSVDGKMRYRRA